MNVIRTFLIPKVFLLVFTIFIFMQNKGQNETQVKLIAITYWIKWLLVIQVLVKIHGMYECITSWCVLELVRTSELIAYLLRDLCDAIFIHRLLIGSETLFGQLLINCVSSGFPMSLLMPPDMGQVYACCSVVGSLHWFHRRWCQEIWFPRRWIS